MKLLLRNAKQLVTCSSAGQPFKRGKEMSEVGELHGADVSIEDGIIKEVGRNLSLANCDVVDVSDKIVIPGFVDPHTHVIFDGSREKEFAMRAGSKSYSEIAANGGGILDTVRATRVAQKSTLRHLAATRIEKMLRWGTTAIEIKSGYGLDFKNEVKLLEAAIELKDEVIPDVAVTFLGAHTVPPEYMDNRAEYLKIVTDELIPYIVEREIANFCDVFCDNGFFSLEETKYILTSAASYGLRLKLHADELTSSGAVMLATELNAVSVDHLENISPDETEALSASNTIGVVLPAVAAYLRSKPAPARELIDKGCAIAIGSDFNPGTSMVDNMQTVMWLAISMNGMTVEEALNSATINAAAAIAMSDRIGSIEVGKRADMLIIDAPDYSYLPYHFTENRITNVVKNGTILEFH